MCIFFALPTSSDMLPSGSPCRLPPPLQLLIMAFMTSTMFVNYPKDNANNANTYMSVIFFSLMFM